MPPTLPKTWCPPPDQNLFAVFDPCRNELLARTRRLAASRQTCLWSGTLGAALADCAPHLVALAPNTAFFRQFLATGDSFDHGYLCLSTASLDELAAHFQRLVMVAAPPHGSALHFRFQDARVWRTLLRNSSSRDLAILFGPVTEFILRGDDDGLHRLALSDEGRLQQEPL